MKIYFAGSIRGGRSQIQRFKKIIEELKKYGQVFGEHIQNEDLSIYGETSLASDEILEREKKMIFESDVVVAEVSTPSLGVGYLLSHASDLNKKIFAMYEGEDSLKLSAIIKGDKNIRVVLYKNDNNIEEQVKNLFKI